MSAPLKIRAGRVSSRLPSSNAQVSNLIRRTVPVSGRSYDPVSGEWIISAARVPALLAALRAAGVEVEEIGGAR